MLCQELCYDITRIVAWYSFMQDFFLSQGHRVSLEFINTSVFTRSASFGSICAFDNAPHSQRWTTAL
jgi:hypothetical protein